MALTETLDLDIRAAQNQLSRLNAQLDQLAQPLNIPVNISGDNNADQLRRDLDQADNAAESLNSELRETDRELGQIDRSADQASNAMLRVGTRGVSAFTNLRGSLLGAVAAVGVFAGATAALRGAFTALQAASSLEESLSKTNVVFGSLSGSIQRFAATAPKALGLSTAAALEATSTFGNLFVALGLSQQAAADLSPDIVQLASDLASFNNIAVAEAVEKLRSGLVGEAEPLRALGVNINAALVEAKALELGLVDASGAVTEAGKVQARYALILEQTSTAQGDYARTADGIANTQRTLNAEFENAKVAIGQALIPAFQELLEKAPNLIAQLVDMAPAFGNLANAAIDLVGPLADVVGLLGNVVGPLSDLKSSFGDAAIAEDQLTQGLGRIADLFTEGGISGAVGTFDLLKDAINGVDPALLERTLRGIAEALENGRDPAILLAEGFRELNAGGTITVEVLRGLLDTVGASDVALRKFLSRTIQNADALHLSADEVRALIDELVILQDFSRRQPGGNDGFKFDTPELTPSQIAAFEAQIAGLPDIIKGGLDQAQRDAAADAEAFAQGFVDSLTGSFSESMRDAEGTLETDASQFVDRFIADLEEEALFESNLAKIRKLGGILLAEMLAAEGAEEGGALAADFLKDPGEIADFEEAGRARGLALAKGELDEFLATIEAADFSSVVVPPIVIPLVFGVLPDIPTVAFTAGGIGPTGAVSTNIEVNINNPTTQDVVTDSVRAGGIINGVIAGQRGAQ